MDIEGKGVKVSVNPAEQPDDWLISAAQEIAEAAEARGLELRAFTGTVAVESARGDAETDVEAPTPVTKESLAEQLNTAFMGYQATAEQLNGDRKKKEQIEVADQETVARELEDWLTEEKVAYVASAMEADPELRFTLVATPNVTATADEVIKGTRVFGEGQPYATEVWSDILKKYSPEEVSGTNPENGNSVKFKLVPDKFTPELYGTVKFQKDKLAELQTDTPFLNATSPLEDLTRLQTLRASGNALVGLGTADATYMRNFTMEPKRLLDGWSRLPDSSVGDGGEPRLDGSIVQFGGGGRVSVG